MVASRSLPRAWRALCCTVPNRLALCAAVADASTEPMSLGIAHGTMDVASNGLAQAGDATQAGMRRTKFACNTLDRRHFEAPHLPKLALATPCVRAESAHTLGEAVTVQALLRQLLRIGSSGPRCALDNASAHRKTRP